MVEFAGVKKSSGISSGYVRQVELCVERLLRASGCEYDTIERAQVQAWFDGLPERNSTKATRLGHLKSFFGFVHARGYRHDNPARGISIGRPAEPERRVLTVDECERLLRICNRSIKAGIVLGMFCGIRPQEVIRLRWGDVNLQEGRVLLDSAITKVRKRRAVPVPSNAVVMLRELKRDDQERVTMTRPTVKWRLGLMAEEMGWGAWPKDCLRHTAISYALARDGDIYRTATWAGNSPDIIRRHYMQLVSRSEAERFFALEI